MQITNVRYVKSSSGAKLRNAAAGATVVKTLSAGDLMYDIPGVATVNKALSGTTYTWCKVCAYTVENNKSVSYSGWIALENTTVVSRTVPSKSSVVCSNEQLNQRKQLINARYIYNYLTNKGWGKFPILAIIGNMERESYLNPGKTQDSGGGYGLTQWTPATKLTDWLGSKSKSDINNQLDRIIYEANNNKQWDTSLCSQHNLATMKFSSFPTSTKPLDELAAQFYVCYENNKKYEDEDRKAIARKWYTLIGYLTD